MISPSTAAATASQGVRLSDFIEEAGPSMSAVDRRMLEHVVKPLGSSFLGDVRPKRIKDVLSSLTIKGHRAGDQPTTETTRKVLGAIRRLFDAAIGAELVESNPARDVKLPRKRGEDREVKRERMILTDDEIVQLVRCERVHFELRVMAIAARVLGGMRTSGRSDPAPRSRCGHSWPFAAESR
jgi:site-specific recombinase XerC